MMLEPPGDEEPEDEPEEDLILGMSMHQSGTALKEQGGINIRLCNSQIIFTGGYGCFNFSTCSIALQSKIIHFWFVLVLFLFLIYFIYLCSKCDLFHFL